MKLLTETIDMYKEVIWCLHNGDSRSANEYFSACEAEMYKLAWTNKWSEQELIKYIEKESLELTQEILKMREEGLD